MRVNVIYEDRSGAFWLGTHRGGLDKFIPETGRFVHHVHDPEDPNSLSSNEVWVIHEGRDGVLWVGTDIGGLNRFDRDQEQWTNYKPDAGRSGSLSHNEVRAILEDASGVLWIGTKGGGLNRFNPETETFEHWGNVHGDTESLSNDFVYSMVEDGSGALWIGSDGGLNRFSKDEGRVSRFTYDRGDIGSLSDNSIRSLYEDRSGVLWVGTNNGGLCKMRKGMGVFRHRHFTLEKRGLFSIYEDDSNVLWMGTNESGVLEFDYLAGRLTRHQYRAESSNGLANVRVWAVAEDSKGVLWLGAREIVGFDRAAGSLASGILKEPLRYGVASGGNHDIKQVYIDQSDILWLGSDVGLIRVDPSSWQARHYRHDPMDASTLSHDRVSAIAEGADGTLWVGTYAGLNSFDRTTGTFYRHQHDSETSGGLASNLIRSIYEDLSGDLWVGTNLGISRLDRASGEFANFSEVDGLSGKQIVCITEDDDRSLWLGTDKGLTRFDLQTKVFRDYDELDGLMLHQVLSCFKNSHGEILLGGFTEVVVFDPAELPRNSIVPPVAITGLRASNSGRELGQHAFGLEGVELRHDDNSLGISFSALDHTAPDKNQYAYKLDGFDEHWVFNNKERSVTYTNIDPGEYVFRVRGSNNDGVWNEQGALVRIRIRPPFWETWWFLASGLSAVVLLVVIAHRLRMRAVRRTNVVLEKANAQLTEEVIRRQQTESDRERIIGELEIKKAELEAQNVELERFTYTISHDLKSPLVTIQGFLGYLERDSLAGNVNQVKRDIERIQKAAERMAQLLEELLELSRVGRVVNPLKELALEDVAQEATEQVAGQIAEVGAEVEIYSGLPSVLGDHPRLVEVFQNLIDNAVKFMGDQPHPRVEIGCKEEGREIVYYVRDNGIGIEPRFHDKVFGLFDRLDQQIDGTGVGLALVKRIIEVHGGRLWVESEGGGSGSTFCFTLSPDSHGFSPDSHG